MRSIMRGKTVNDWVARTFCSFGIPERVQEVGKHYSEETAARQFKRICKLPRGGLNAPHFHVWTELRDGTLIFDNLRDAGANFSLSGGRPVDWEEDIHYSSKDWRADVAAGRTRLGYREWYRAKACE